MLTCRCSPRICQVDPGFSINQFLSSEVASKENKWQGSNVTRWRSPEYDQLYAQSEVEIDPVKRATMLIALNDMVIRNVVRDSGGDPSLRHSGGEQPTRAAQRLGQRHVRHRGLVSRHLISEAGDGSRGRLHCRSTQAGPHNPILFNPTTGMIWPSGLGRGRIGSHDSLREGHLPEAND